MSNSNSLEHNRRMGNKIGVGCCGCFVGVFVLAFIFIFIGVIVSGSGDVYEGSRVGMSSKDKQERDNLYYSKLGEIGIVLDIENRENTDIDLTLKTIHNAPDLTAPERQELAYYLGSFMGIYYVEENQNGINQILEELKLNLETGEIEENENNSEYILKKIYMTRVVDYAISPEVSNENLQEIDIFIGEYYRYVKNTYYSLNGVDSQHLSSPEVKESNMKSLKERSVSFEVPVIEE